MSETHSCFNLSSVYVCACVVCALYMRTSVRIFSGHNSTLVHGFQNNLAKLLSQRSNSAIRNICSGTLELKVTLEGQMIKWLLQMCAHALCLRPSGFVWAIPCIFVHGFQNNLAQLVSLRGKNAI